MSLDADIPSKPIRSPNYPNSYDNDQECIWTVNSPAGTYVKITFLSFEVCSMTLSNVNNCDCYINVTD